MPRVVIFVFDGLQAELVTPELMPRLHEFAATGLRLAGHQPVFPSVTRVNASSIVTGCFPGTHGLPGNLSLIPAYHPTEPMNAMRPEFLELARRDGRLLLVPTLAEVLAGHGLDYVAAGIGSTGQSFVHHPNADHPNGNTPTLGASIHPEYTLPGDLHHQLTARFGPWPPPALPNAARIDRLVDVVTRYVLADRDPAVALLWCSEPDGSQHASPLNSGLVRAAAGAADAAFGRLLDWLEESGTASTTDVIVTCDHGHSTVDALVPLPELLAAAGFAPPGDPGGVVAAGNGGAALLYVPDGDRAVADRLAAWLMTQWWAGPLLASPRLGPIEGTLSTALLGLDGERGPDFALSFAWDDRPNDHGQRGYVYASGGKPGHGQHGSMSPAELRTFTVARGPAFRANATVSTPTGHPDLAPTVLRILGLDPPPHMDGRVIEEALVGGAPTPEPPAPLEEHVATRRLEGGDYRQRLLLAPAGRGAYVLEASAEHE